MAIVLRLTALILLLRPMGPWWVAPFLLGLAGLAIIFPQILNSSATWYALAGFVSLRILEDWPLADNHVYLLAYWCFAIALALGSADTKSVLSRSSRIMIGLAFLFAITWKVFLSPDYLDRRFFRITFLTDARFENVTLLTGFTGDQLIESREYLQPLPDGADALDAPTLHDTPLFSAMVAVATWGTAVIETLCAICFLVPLAGRSAIRHLLLLGFCVVTYALAPVAGFGWLLLTMGLASVDDDDRRFRAAYITTWMLVLLYDQVPWTGLIVDWFDLAK